MEPTYCPDLAEIHDAGFVQFAEAGAALLRAELNRANLLAGTVVDLGCGSGILCERLAAVGYGVFGVDLSPAFIEIARKRVPAGRFEVGSLLNANLPTCVAVAMIGECGNYLFDPNHSVDRLWELFRTVHAALAPGGMFLLDVATPGRVPGGKSQGGRATADWAVVYEAEEDVEKQLLVRRITTFRREPQGQQYRRTDETHRLRLIPADEVEAELQRVGFACQRLAGYGHAAFPPGWVGFLARKPT